MKKVSIITPAYNSAIYIEDAIKSVLSQTYQNWEMLIVDDCSSDNTVEIVLSYCAKDDRIKLIKHQENKGVAGTRNTALKVANGNYIAFLDSDDMWLPRKLENQVKFMEEESCVLSYTAYQKYYSDTGERGSVIKVPSRMTYNSIFYNTAIACLTVMVNRDLSGNFEMPLLNHTEDQCTWQAIIKKSKYAMGLNDNLALYRISSSSLTANKWNALKKQWYTYRKYHKLSIIKSGVYFIGYVMNAIIKHSKK